MNADPYYPRRAKLLAEVLRPVGHKIAMQINRRTCPTRHEVNIVAVVTRHLLTLQALMRRVGDCVNGLMCDVLSNPVAIDADIRRATRRIEACIDDLCSGYSNVYALNVGGRDAVARNLLAGVYRHTMRELQVWIEQLVRALSDPRAELRRRGLPTSGKVTLTVPLTLTTAPELAGLSRWTSGRNGEHSEVSATATKSGSGILHKAGNLLLAWGIADVLSGDDD